MGETRRDGGWYSKWRLLGRERMIWRWQVRNQDMPVQWGHDSGVREPANIGLLWHLLTSKFSAIRVVARNQLQWVLTLQKSANHCFSFFFFLPRKQREFWWSQPNKLHTCLKSTICECACGNLKPGVCIREAAVSLQGWLPVQERICNGLTCPQIILAASQSKSTSHICSFGFWRVFTLCKCKRSCVGDSLSHPSPASSPPEFFCCSYLYYT